LTNSQFIPLDVIELDRRPSSCVGSGGVNWLYFSAFGVAYRLWIYVGIRYIIGLFMIR